MGRIIGALGALALALTSTGCWEQPGFDAGRTNWNSAETRITSGNVDELVPLWDVNVPDVVWLGAPISRGGSIFVPSWNAVHRVDAETGEIRWTQAVGDFGEPFFPIPDLAFFDGSVVATWGITTSFASIGETAHLAPRTGEVRSLTDGSNFMDLGIAGGALAVETFDGGAMAGGAFRLHWTYEPTLGFAGLETGDHAAGPWAIVGERVAWSKNTRAYGFSPACPPVTEPFPISGCGHDWATDLGAEIIDVAAVGSDRAVYVDRSGTVSVVDIATGVVLWTGEVGAESYFLTVAGGTIFVPAGNRLVAFAADGCGAATCDPAWDALLPGLASTSVAGGDVVYVGAGGDIHAFDFAGAPLATIDAGADMSPIVVDRGRLLATGIDGRLAAFGLPGSLP